MTFEEFYNRLNDIEKPLMKFYEEILMCLHPVEILEIGSGWGLFSRACMEYTTGNLTTIDKLSLENLPVFRENTEGFKERIFFHNESSRELLARWSQPDFKKRFDFIFVDGDHGQEPALNDMRLAWNLLKPGGTMMIDDVFHRWNWKWIENDKQFNCGVTQAVWTWIQEAQTEFQNRAEIVPVAHGIVIVQKKI